MKRLRLREHGVIKVAIGSDGAEPAVTPAQARALAHACKASGALRFSSDVQLKASEIVGVVIAGGVQVEILPKIDGLDEGSTRLNLVRMLARAGYLPFSEKDADALDWRRTDLLDVVMRSFLTRVEAEARRGLARRYVSFSDDLPKLRGRIDVAFQYSRNVSRPQLLACRFDELSVDTPLNRAFRCALELILLLAWSAETRRHAMVCLSLFDEVARVRPADLDWPQITIDRTNSRFRTLLELARLLLSGLHQTTSLGGEAGFALLFDMNLLFERYVGRCMARALPGRVRLQGPCGYVLHDMSSGRPAFQTTPDILVTSGDQRTVVDTKWKRLDPCEGLLGVSQADVYQMMAYAQVYKASRLILLYPLHEGLRGIELPRRFLINGAPALLEVATLDLSDLSRTTTILSDLMAHSLHANPAGALLESAKEEGRHPPLKATKANRTKTE